MSRVFTHGPGDQGSIRARVIPKTQKMVLDAALINIKHYKLRIMGKVEQSLEYSSALPYTFGVVAIEKVAFGLPSTKSLTYILTDEVRTVMHFVIEQRRLKRFLRIDI